MSARARADRIEAKTDQQAKQRFLQFLQQSLTAVHATAVWLVTPVPGEQGSFNAVTKPDTLTLKTASGGPMYLRSTIGFSYEDDSRYTGERKVLTRFYPHTLSDEPDTELFSWHWHAEHEPHLHICPKKPEIGLGRLHVPTGRVSFEQIARFAMLEYDVLPSRKLGTTASARREEALRRLDDSHDRWKRYRSWG